MLEVLKLEIWNEIFSRELFIKCRKNVCYLQLIMKKNGSYYGYGDFRRPDSYASGDIK